MVDAAAVTQLSKYVLDYAPRSLAAAAIVPLPGGVRLAPRVEYRRRSRTSGQQDYVLLDARVSRALGRAFELCVEGTNLFDVSYQEIAGVAMPGAAMSVSLAVRRAEAHAAGHGQDPLYTDPSYRTRLTRRVPYALVRAVPAASGSAASRVPTPDRRRGCRRPV